MEIKKTLVAGAIAAALSGATISSTTMANPLLNYTYIEAGGVKQELKGNGGSTEADGWYTQGSLRRGNIVLQLGYATSEMDKINGVDVGNLDIDIRDINLFVGGIRELGEQTSLLIGFGINDQDWDSNAIDLDVKQYYLSAEIRHLIAPQVEINGSLSYVHSDIEDDDTESDPYATVGLRFHVTEQTSVGVEYQQNLDDSDDEAVSGNLRYQF